MPNKKILAVVSEPISADALRSAVGPEVQEETVERLDEEGIDAAGDTGEEDPLLAIQDALATFDADEVVLFTHSGGKQNWLEEGLVDEAGSRFDVPVRHLVVEQLRTFHHGDFA